MWAQTGQLKTSAEVLERYQHALGGVEAIRKVRSETRHVAVQSDHGQATLIIYGKPFKSLTKVKLPGGQEITSGFDGQVSWSVTPQGASIDTDTPVESARRDADLQYSLHQPDYFTKLELSGITDFEGHRCYWLHGTTHWGKDNNQFYDVETGLLAGYRFQSDSSTSAVVTTLLFQDYNSFGGPLVATKNILRTAGNTQTFTITSVSYEPLDDSMFEAPAAVKALRP
jgi:hypothetical protein